MTMLCGSTAYQYAVSEAYYKAKTAYPNKADATRLKRAYDALVCGSGVIRPGTLPGVYHVTVGHSYPVSRSMPHLPDWRCTCPDYCKLNKYGATYCKHVWCLLLHAKALVLMRESYYRQNDVLLGNVLLAEQQRLADGDLVKKVCGIAQ